MYIDIIKKLGIENFEAANSDQINWLSDKAPKWLIEFYSQNLPVCTGDFKYRILGFDDIVEENEKLVPGVFVLSHGFFVIGSDYDGDAIATNDSKKIYRISHSIFSKDPATYFDKNSMSLLTKPITEDLIIERSELLYLTFVEFLSALLEEE